MTLIPTSVIDAKRCNADIEIRKHDIYEFLEYDLDENEIAYYSQCINKIHAFRAINAAKLKKGRSLIDKSRIEIEEDTSYTEKEIKTFIILENTSLFSPFEYKYLYGKYIDTNDELKRVI